MKTEWFQDCWLWWTIKFVCLSLIDNETFWREVKWIWIFRAPVGNIIILEFPLLDVCLSNFRFRNRHLLPSPPQIPHWSCLTGDPRIWNIINNGIIFPIFFLSTSELKFKFIVMCQTHHITAQRYTFSLNTNIIWAVIGTSGTINNIFTSLVKFSGFSAVAC